MIIYFILWVINLAHVHSYVLKSSHASTGQLINKINQLRHSADYIEKDNLTRVNEIRFNYSNHCRSIGNVNKNNKNGLNGPKIHNKLVTFTRITNSREVHSLRNKALDIETSDYYDYKHLLEEYYEEAINDTKSNTSYRVKNDTESNILSTIRKTFNMKSKKCTQQDIGLKAIKCLFLEYQKRKLSTYTFVARLWSIIRVWFLIYITLAIPLWCTRGLCCCCLFCKFFKPHRTIEKAKKYFIMNPPGLLKTSKGQEVLYEPTKNERDTYEEFEHLIRTI